MPEYKLIYFNGRGLAELSRWIMHYGKIPFTDERFEHDEWPERKKTMPGGKVPVLDVDGRLLPQSVAIGRFLATKAGLVPEDPLHAAYCDALVETLRDVVVEIFRIKSEEGKSEEERQKKLDEEYLPNTLWPMLERINKRLDDKEWFIGDKISWADLAIGCSAEGLYANPSLPGLDTKFPKIKAHVEKIKNLPGIKEWIQKRPETSF